MIVAMSAAPQATTQLPVEFGEMVQGSQLVIHGRVVDVRGQQTSDRRSIETVVTLAVTEALKGQPGGTVTFRMPGGEVGRYRRVVVGVPQFTSGDDVVVFLRGAPPAMPMVFGLSQGLYRVARTADGRAVVTRGQLPLDVLAREVRARAEARP
jgi:hypothetical protein